MNTDYITESLSRRISLMSLVAAVLVVFIHVPHGMQKLTMDSFIVNFIAEGVCNIAVPFFFVVSGFMLARHCDETGWWIGELKKRMRTVLIPYIIWCLIFTGILTLNAVMANKSNGRFVFANLNCLFPFNFLGLSPFANPPSPLWYLRTLMLFVLVSPIICGIVRTKFALLVICLFFWGDIAALTWLAPLSTGLSNIVWFTFPLNGLFYFMAGCYFVRRPMVIKRNWSILLGLLGCGLIIIKILALSGVLLLPTFLHYLIDRVGVLLLLVAVWIVMPSFSLPNVLAGMSFPIYLMHDIPLIFISLVLKKWFNTHSLPLGWYVLLGGGNCDLCFCDANTSIQVSYGTLFALWRKMIGERK